MDSLAYFIIALIYLSGFALTVYLLKTDFFGYAAFAAPFLTYPIATILCFLLIKLLSLEFDFADNIPYFLGGFAAYSILSLLLVMLVVPQTKVHNIKAKELTSDAQELDIFDEYARPTGEKIPSSDIRDELEQVSFILQYGRHYVARVPDQYEKPYLKPRNLYIDPAHLKFKGPEKLRKMQFTQDRKPAVIRELEVFVSGLKKEVKEISLLDRSGNASNRSMDREDFQELPPITSKAVITSGKVIILIPIDGSWRKGIRVLPEHLTFESSVDEERIEKFKQYNNVRA